MSAYKIKSMGVLRMPVIRKGRSTFNMPRILNQVSKEIDVIIAGTDWIQKNEVDFSSLKDVQVNIDVSEIKRSDRVLILGTVQDLSHAASKQHLRSVYKNARSVCTIAKPAIGTKPYQMLAELFSLSNELKPNFNFIVNLI